MCTNQYHSLHTHPLFRHPTPSSPTLLRNMMFPPDPPLLQYIPHNSGRAAARFVPLRDRDPDMEEVPSFPVSKVRAAARFGPLRDRDPDMEEVPGPASSFPVSKARAPMLGGWVNPHRGQQTIPQGQTSSPPKSFLTPTAKARPDQAALATSAEARGATHRARPRSPGATRLYTHSHELPALTALAQHISHSHSGIDEKRLDGKVCTCERLQMPTPPSLAYTRCYFVSGFVCTNQYYSLHTHPLFSPPPLPSSPTLLRNIMFPPDPPLLQYIPHNIGHGNIVYRPTCT